MDNKNRVGGYIASLIVSSLFYLLWFVVSSALEYRQRNQPVDLPLSIVLAVFFLFFQGTGTALVLMAIPWYFAVCAYDRIQRFGRIYFPLIGAATLLVIGCGTSSLAPKPLFIEDQTFLEGFMIALERQGLCLFLCGVLFGVTYWLIASKSRNSPAGNSASRRDDATSGCARR